MTWNIIHPRFLCNLKIKESGIHFAAVAARCDHLIVMKTEREQLESRHSQAASDETLVCEACGRFDAARIGERTLCVDCFQGCGSCCPEFGKDDLWTFPEDQDEKSDTCGD